MQPASSETSRAIAIPRTDRNAPGSPFAEPILRGSWHVPQIPAYAGGRIVTLAEQAWTSATLVLVHVRPENALAVTFEAACTCVVIALEEIGGRLELRETSRPGPPSRSRGAVS